MIQICKVFKGTRGKKLVTKMLQEISLRKKTKARSERRKEREGRGELMKSKIFIIPASLQTLMSLWVSWVSTCPLLSQAENAISVFNFPGPSSSLSHIARQGNA